ncbi:MAG: DNA polymerase IV [bacterium]
MAVRRIFCLDMDCFFVSVERVLNPTLVGKPVIVGAKPNQRGVVAACSYETRLYGVHSGMPSSRAGILCPNAIFVHGNHEHYALFSREVRATLEGYVPVVQPASIDEFFLDMTGTERLYGPMIKSAKRIKRMIYRRTKLPCTIGIGSSKMIAKIACNLAKPNGLMEIAPGDEENFLKDLPVGEMPGIGKVMQEKLHEWGVLKLGEVASLPLPILKGAFGKHGEAMKARARGISGGDVDPVHGPPKSVGHECTFHADSEDPVVIESVLHRLAEKIGRRLRRKSLMAKTITLKFRLSNFETITRAHTINQPTDRDAVIFEIAKEQFRKAYGSRSRVRLVGIRATKFSINAGQLPLFGTEDELKMQKFYEGLDDIRNRYGFESIIKGRNFPKNQASA